ncbi:MAG: methyltransferase domain-containing protein [Planctomycetota bacterium]|nr:methyltransferase domain-containing protein [Planctomycetota bacterium]
MGVTWHERKEARRAVRARVRRTDVVLDVGCGIRPMDYFRPRTHLVVEPHKPYIETMLGKQDDPTRFVPFNGTWDQVLPLLPDASVDSVFALDVIEHMEKDDGLKFLREAERVARCQVMIFTPLGFFPQSYEHEGAEDRWGMDGAYWQTHRSGWEPDDFGDGWDLVCCKAFHTKDDEGNPLDEPFGAIWGFYDLEHGRYRGTAGDFRGRMARRLGRLFGRR